MIINVYTAQPSVHKHSALYICLYLIQFFVYLERVYDNQCPYGATVRSQTSYFVYLSIFDLIFRVFGAIVL